MTGEIHEVEWVRDWADRVDDLGLSVLVEPLLDLAQAFGSLGAHALLAAEPLSGGAIDGSVIGRLVALLDQPGLIEEFRACLQRGED